MSTNQQAHRPIGTRLKLSARIVGGLLGLVICIVAINLGMSKMHTDHEHARLVNEFSSLQLSSSKPVIIGFENEPTDSEQLLSSTYPGVAMKLAITQTTLRDEIDAIKTALQNHQFTIQYNSQSMPTDIIGTSKSYFINIGLAYNGSDLPLVNNGQSLNGGQFLLSQALTRQ